MTEPRLFLVTLGLAVAAVLGAATCDTRCAEMDYAEPKLLLGTVYETSSGTNKVLFTSKRTAIKSNATVHVLCDYFYPNGALAARETMVFERGRLAMFDLDEKQTGAHGSAIVAPDPK